MVSREYVLYGEVQGVDRVCEVLDHVLSKHYVVWLSDNKRIVSLVFKFMSIVRNISQDLHFRIMFMKLGIFFCTKKCLFHCIVKESEIFKQGLIG